MIKIHGKSLADVALRTLMVKVEVVVNARPLTVDTISDVDSQIPISPSNLLTMKSNVVMPPPGNFEKLDLHCRKRWRQVQHITKEFWSRWRKEFLATLQSRAKWKGISRNFQIGDVVLLRDDQAQNQRPMAQIIETEPDQHGIVQSVKLKVAGSKLNETLRRPISKLVLLVSSDNSNDTL